jgi:Snurportin1
MIWSIMPGNQSIPVSFTHAQYKAKSLGGANQEVRRKRLLAYQKEKRDDLVNHAR